MAEILNFQGSAHLIGVGSLSDKLYDKFTDLEKKEFLSSFVEQVDIYEQEQPDGRFLKHIKFRFPVYFNGSEIEELSWDNEITVETVVGLQRKDT